MVDRNERCDDSEERRRLPVGLGSRKKEKYADIKLVVNKTMKSPVCVPVLLSFNRDGHFFPNAILSATKRSFPIGCFG